MDYLISDMWDYLMSTVAGTLEYKALIVVGMLLALLVLVVPGRKLSDRVAFAALAAYLTLVFASTVLLRTTADGGGVSLTPFSSYAQVFAGNRKLLFENLENIVLFVPAGLALGYLCRNAKFWECLLAIVGTAMFSVGIETLQYIYKVGVLEFDDLFNNTLGIIVGFAFARGICSLFRPRNKAASKQGAAPKPEPAPAQAAVQAAPGQTRVDVGRQQAKASAPARTPRAPQGQPHTQGQWDPKTQPQDMYQDTYPNDADYAADSGQTRVIGNPADYAEAESWRGGTRRL